MNVHGAFGDLACLIMSDRTSLQQHLLYYRRYTVYRTPRAQLQWKIKSSVVVRALVCT